MIKNVLSEIGGVGLYGVVSICLFFTIFVGALAVVCRTSRAHVQHMGTLPLEDDEHPATSDIEPSHE